MSIWLYTTNVYILRTIALVGQAFSNAIKIGISKISLWLVVNEYVYIVFRYQHFHDGGESVYSPSFKHAQISCSGTRDYGTVATLEVSMWGVMLGVGTNKERSGGES